MQSLATPVTTKKDEKMFLAFADLKSEI